MNSLPWILVITSALSAFGQYIGNQHADKINRRINQLKECGFKKNDGKFVPWSQEGRLKTEWDDLINTDPISIKIPVLLLFSVLIACLCLLTAFEYSIASGQYRKQLDQFMPWTLFGLSSSLTVISFFIIIVWFRMGRMEKKYGNKVESFLDRHKVARSSYYKGREESATETKANGDKE